MTTQPNPNAAALMSALVADAATLGTHWIYDPARIGKIANNSPAFVPINAQNYDGVPAYFAHAARKNGDQSQYGEVLALAIRCITTNDGFDVTGYQDAFVAHFGAGGAYQGYIDRPTRGALDNISADQRAPSGTDDDQHPAIATLPALVARYRGSDDFADHITAAVHITNVNEAADHYAGIFADLLADVLSGTDLQHALKTAAKREPLLQAALDTSETDSIAYGEITGRPCHLYQGMPLVFHILANTDSYHTAVEANILAGGDNCGRSLMVGSLAGAAYGIAEIPLDWILATNSSGDIWPLLKKF